ncbi:MAG: hypothetical protein Q7R92_02935 [bacterium]|nr:hypothetical protein [bacterium]
MEEKKIEEEKKEDEKTEEKAGAGVYDGYCLLADRCVDLGG